MSWLKRRYSSVKESESIRLGFQRFDNSDVLNLSIGIPILNEVPKIDKDLKSFPYGTATLSDSVRANIIKLMFKAELDINDIIPTLGAKGGLKLLLDILDVKKMGLFFPTWLGYKSLAEINDIEIVEIPERTSREELIKKIKEIDVIIVCNPNNPTGEIFDFNDFVDLVHLCEQNQALLLLDEVYKDLAFSDLAEFDEIVSPNLIRLGSFSKSFGLPGLRLGYIHSINSEIINAATLYVQHSYTSLPMSSASIVENLTLSDKNKYLNAVMPLYKERIDHVANLLKRLGLKIWSQESAFYLFVETELDINLADFFFEKYSIIAVSGDAYGGTYKQARLSLAIDHADFIKLKTRLSS
jgi:threonine-phosphate decarboxylase